MTDKKKRTPSQIEYDENHPLFSCRVSKETMAVVGSKDKEEIVRVGAGLLKLHNEITSDELCKAEWDGYNAGMKGYARGDRAGMPVSEIVDGKLVY